MFHPNTTYEKNVPKLLRKFRDNFKQIGRKRVGIGIIVNLSQVITHKSAHNLHSSVTNLH